MKCNNCNYEYDKKTEFCPNCGIKVEKTIKKSNSGLIVIISVLAVALVSVVVFLIFNNMSPKKNNPKRGEDTKELNNKTKATKKKNEIGGYEYYEMDIDADNIKIVYDGDLGKNIKVEKVFYDKHGLHVLATNNNTIPVRPSVDLYFLDDAGKRVDKGLGSALEVAAGKKFATDVSTTSKKEFYDYELHVSANKIKSYEHMLDLDLNSFNISEIDNSLLIKYNNTSENTVSLYFSVIYYKNDKMHYIDDVYVFVKPGEEGSINSYYYISPLGSTNQKDFDRYEIILSGAKSSDSTY